MNVKYRKGSSKEIYNNIDKIIDGEFVWATDTKRLYLKMDGELSAITPTRKRTALNCINCGSPLPMPSKHYAFLKCEYCGTIQDIDIW